MTFDPGRSRPGAAIAVAVAAMASLAACADPKQAFQDFVDRVPDASTVMIDAPPIDTLPDVTGPVLFGLKPVVAPDPPVQLLGTFTLTMNEDGTGTLDAMFVPLAIADRTPLGTPSMYSGISVNDAGEYVLQAPGLMIPAAANALNVDATADLELAGRMLDADRTCGQLNGMITLPTDVPLDGSDFGTLRVAEGAVGDDLPPPLVECP